MSIIESNSILFIRAPSHNLRTVEHFLQKRDFKVFVEHDVKMAMLKVVEVKPSIIFLAWDHPNQKILELPHVMAHSSEATIIPYVMGFTKEDVRKLDACALNPKLYPPISGPAIERLITKFIKIQIRKNPEFDAIVGNYKNEKEQEANAAKAAAPGLDPVEAALHAINAEAKPVLNQNFVVIKQQKRQEILLRYKGKGLSPGIAAELKKTFPVKVKMPVEKMLSALEKQGSQKTGLSKNSETKLFRAYCLPVVSNDWCGYLTVVSDQALEAEALRLILSEWIRENFIGGIENDKPDFIEINNLEPEWLEILENETEYYEKLNSKEYDIRVSFFSVDPTKMNIEFNDVNTMIRMPTHDVPADEELPFGLHLHLPENKKYIAYTQANKKLSLEQKNRLITNKILLVYTPVNFVNEYKKFMTERTVKKFWRDLLKKKTTV